MTQPTTSTPSHIIGVPLSALTISRHNIRRTRTDVDLEQLAASISAEGLLQNLTVARIPPDDTQPAERYEVIAGGRRLRALQLLRDRGELPAALADAVPVNIVAPEIANEVGIAENTIRAPMHPHDEFVAFRDLAATGMPTADIAARFGVDDKVVERRLRLANVAPEILRAFRDDALTLEVMQAFALTTDHALQRRIFDEARSNSRKLFSSAVKQAIRGAGVPISDARVRFVGVEAYEAAGGTVARDLFDPYGGHVEDETLLDQLVTERLRRESETLLAEGWRFVHISTDGHDYSFGGKCERSKPKREEIELTQAQLDERDQLIAENEKLNELLDEMDDDPSKWDGYEAERIELRRAEIERALAAIPTHRDVYSDRQRAKSGCMIYFDDDGNLEIVRGLIPIEGTKAEKAANQAESTATGAPPTPAAPTLAQSMLQRLSLHRQIALQCELAQRPNIAVATLAHALLLDTLYAREFDGPDTASPLHINATPHLRDATSFRFEDAENSKALAELQQYIEDTRTALGLPQRRAELFPWLLQASRESVIELLAIATALTVNTVVRSPAEQQKGQLLAQALDLDMADFWRLTAANFGSLVPRALIVEAVREVHGEAQAERIAAMKKDEAAGEAERLLATTGWLPKPLRRPGYRLRTAAPTEPETAPEPEEAPPEKLAKPTKKKAPAKKPATKRATKKAAAKKAVAKKKPAAKKGKK